MPLQAPQADSALYANLANALFARFYAKSLSRPQSRTPHVASSSFQIADSLMLRDLSVLYAHHFDRFKMGLAVSRSNSEELAIACAVIGFVSRYAISIRTLPVHFRMKVRERLDMKNVSSQIPISFDVSLYDA
jgi:hypothetical protein